MNLSPNVLRNRKRRRLVDDVELLEIPAAQRGQHDHPRMRDESERLTKAMTQLNATGAGDPAALLQARR